MFVKQQYRSSLHEGNNILRKRLTLKLFTRDLLIVLIVFLCVAETTSFTETVCLKSALIHHSA